MALWKNFKKKANLAPIKREEEELAIWDVTVGDSIEDEDWGFLLTAEEIEKIKNSGGLQKIKQNDRGIKNI